MSKQIKISIIIPCFNDGEYIKEAIASINNQTCKALEIIIIDDASTDAQTEQVLSKLKQDNLTVIYMEQNAGPAVARNRGIELAKGKYILPLDADDKIAPTYLEKAKEILDDHSEVGIVYCEAEFFGEETGKWDLLSYSFPEILITNMVFATAMYRKSDWESVGGYNKNMLKGNEDYDFWLSLIEHNTGVYQIDEVLFYYRIKKTSRTQKLRQNRQALIDSFHQLYLNHEALYDKHKVFIFQRLIEKEQEHNIIIEDKVKEIKDVHHMLYETTSKLGHDLAYARSIVELRDKQIQSLQYLVESLHWKNQLKRAIKTLIPNSVLIYFGYKINAPLLQGKEAFSYQYNVPEYTPEIKKELSELKENPLISIIMPVYNVDPKWLKLAIQSIEAQWYENWELCIADDKSTNQNLIDYLHGINNPKIKIKFLEKNGNISVATNAALALAEGEYIALMDNDDEITPNALYEMVKAINKNQAEFIYSDEDFISTEGICSNPHFKPDFSPDLLLSHNYITHFTCFKKILLEKVGYFNPQFDGAQDYDLFLRLTEKTDKIFHIQKVLYHWRTLETSTSANSDVKPEALVKGKEVLEATLKRRSIDATVEYTDMHHYFRVKYTIKDNPLVSIIIPFKDKPELIDVCINSILEKSSYRNYEIIGISNNSEEKETFELMRTLEAKDSRITFHEYNTEFNYADINNHGVNTYAKGEHILLLNNDIEVISPDWIEAMLEHSQRPHIGCVGAKLYFPNDTVQHAGIIIGLGGYAGHSHKMYPRDNPGYFNRLNVVQNVSALTAACLMVKKSIYAEMHGLDDVNFKVAYNDVDFCLRVLEKGYLNIFTPFTEMYHHESITRGYETTPEKKARFSEEKRLLGKRHTKILTEGDPYYNPNLTVDKEDFSLCQK